MLEGGTEGGCEEKEFLISEKKDGFERRLPEQPPTSAALRTESNTFWSVQTLGEAKSADQSPNVRRESEWSSEKSEPISERNFRGHPSYSSASFSFSDRPFHFVKTTFQSPEGNAEQVSREIAIGREQPRIANNKILGKFGSKLVIRE